MTYDDSTSLEVCSGSEKDWQTFITLSAETFHDTPRYKQEYPDSEKRKRFLLDYFNCIYKMKYHSNNNAVLVYVKRWNEREVETIYLQVTVFSPRPHKPLKSSELESIDQDVARFCTSYMQWKEDAVMSKMRKISKLLDFELLFFDYHATDRKFRRTGVAGRYYRQARIVSIDEGKRRGLVDPKKDMIVLSIISNLSVKKHVPDMVEIAHLHRSSASTGEKPICVDDPNLESSQEYNCVLPMIACSNHELVAKIKELFNAV